MEGAELSSAECGVDADVLFHEALERETDFSVRRAVERLRDGLFDPVAVRLLTAHEERLKQEMIRGFHALESGKSPHLCLVGAYGQGKSHSLLYLRELARRENFATSSINLDPREIPLHHFREVYRELMRGLRFPCSGEAFPVLWKRWAQSRLNDREGSGGGVNEFLPEDMPHLFRCLLAAMVHENGTSPRREKRSPKGGPLHPRSVSSLLARALEGEVLPVHQLRRVFDHRQVSFHREASLVCRGPEPFWDMIRALSGLFRQMGCRGWVLFLDEGESMVQGNVFARSRSYRLLHRMLFPDGLRPAFVYPVLALTDDFFHRVREEDYSRVLVRRGEETPLFHRNYAEAWGHLNTYRLCDLSRREWKVLARKLTSLHARAYGWQPPSGRLTEELAARMEATQYQETRLRLKALVHCLDLAQQEQVASRT